MKLSDEIKKLGFFEYLNLTNHLTTFFVMIFLFSGMFFLPLFSVFNYGFELGLIPILCIPSFLIFAFCYMSYSEFISHKNSIYYRAYCDEIKRQNRIDEIRRKLGKSDNK